MCVGWYRYYTVQLAETRSWTKFSKAAKLIDMDILMLWVIQTWGEIPVQNCQTHGQAPAPSAKVPGSYSASPGAYSESVWLEHAGWSGWALENVSWLWLALCSNVVTRWLTATTVGIRLISRCEVLLLLQQHQVEPSYHWS